MNFIKLNLISVALVLTSISHADVRDLATGASDTFKLYWSSERLAACRLFHDPTFHQELNVESSVVEFLIKLAVLPAIPLATPILADVKIQQAVAEVEHNALAGDMDLTHSPTYEYLVSIERLQGDITCERPLRIFSRNLHHNLALHAHIASVEANADERERAATPE